jgi:hypothetical protein
MNDSPPTDDVPGGPPRVDRRGFLSRVRTMAAGGVAAAVLLLRRGVASSSEAAVRTPGPGVATPGTRPGEPYFFRIETMGGRTAAGPAVTEV